MPMEFEALPLETEVSHIHLQTQSIARLLPFYTDLLGLQIVKQADNAVLLSANGDLPYLVGLFENKLAKPQQPSSPGLFHVAFRTASRYELSRILKSLVDAGLRLDGAADHAVSEALYLHDPDGNGIEIYADRPRETWPHQGTEVAMVTESLDFDDLLAELERREPSDRERKALRIGHVHLQVADLGRARTFYRDTLGFDVTQSKFPGALFFAAGGYHHHVGANVWNSRGAGPRPAGTTGLLSVGFRLPSRTLVNRCAHRLNEAGISVEERETYAEEKLFHVSDPDGIGIDLAWKD